MKGTIVNCLEKLVVEKFGKEKWIKSLKDAGMSADTVFLITSDIDDTMFMAILSAVCKNLGIMLEQVADIFGEYWVNVYGKKFYSAFYMCKTAKEFLLNMDYVHIAMTQTVENAHPPRFVYEWKNDKTLIMHYKSDRRLIDFVAGLVRGVGIYYKEDLRVTKIGDDKVQIVFP